MKLLLSLLPTVGGWILRLIERRILSKLPTTSIFRTDVTAITARGEEFLEIVSDGDPNDAEQLDKLWRDYVGGDMHASATAKIEHLAERLEPNDPRMAKTVRTIGPFGAGTLKILSDDNSEDLRQITDSGLALVKDSDFQDLVLTDWLAPTLIAKGIPAALVAIILDSIADALPTNNGDGIQSMSLDSALSATTLSGNEEIAKIIRLEISKLEKAAA